VLEAKGQVPGFGLRGLSDGGWGLVDGRAVDSLTNESLRDPLTGLLLSSTLSGLPLLPLSPPSDGDAFLAVIVIVAGAFGMPRYFTFELLKSSIYLAVALLVFFGEDRFCYMLGIVTPCRGILARR
jgi:hypothetical protein